MEIFFWIVIALIAVGIGAVLAGFVVSIRIMRKDRDEARRRNEKQSGRTPEHNDR